ncbi:hypothetical protein F0562_004552 [Nyssa sinensis]|uniref:GPI inositol-deacylase n=1 Tax=Nyssa sinensis TaxID=561372 RepID=A0A5J5C2P0_9ASTE|nr:hypothetical protein F0562_004552 [Nyssa sinensis]
MYTNCLLLGIDPSIIGIGANNGTPRVGLFRHSNPKLGEQLLYFILSSLRGPIQSAKDFDKVWPIFDSAQSRDFRKVVQGIITELESQGALPRSNSRVSSLATCCGPRFVELLWQLSLHALREARIALERRRFLKNAETAVNRQAMWSNLAHEMTAEFRGLSAEEAYLQQELEKLHDLRNKVKLEGELWDELVSSSSQNSHLVQRATRSWDSLLARKNQHEVLASGPIEDLIAHREHRYRISGSTLLAAMDQSSQAPYADVLSVQSGDPASGHLDDKEQIDGSSINVNREKQKNNLDSSSLQVNDENFNRVDDRSGRVHPTVDIAEILRRWTHALQRIHKQSLHLAKSNDGVGPDLLRSADDGSTSSHAESLAVTLAEHRQHRASIQVLIDQLKEVAPSIHNSISELAEEVNSISSNLPPMTKHHGRSISPIQAQSSGRTLESGTDDVAEVGACKSDTHAHTNQMDNMSERKSLDQPLTNNHMDNPPQENENSFVQNLKRSVREAALSMQSCNLESSQDNHSDDSSEHFFVPLSATGFSRLGTEKKLGARSKRLFVSQADPSLIENRASDGPFGSKYDELANVLTDLDSLHEYDGTDGFLSASGSNYAISDSQRSFYDMEEAQDQVFSPPLLMDTSLLAESYEDLLGDCSESAMRRWMPKRYCATTLGAALHRCSQVRSPIRIELSCALKVKPISNGCIMTYMYPTYIPISSPENVSSVKYGLYLYHEGWKKIDFNDHLKKLSGVPVLFIPGNGGSYKQVRSLAAESDRAYQGGPLERTFYQEASLTLEEGGANMDMAGYLLPNQYSHMLDWFAVDLEGEHSAMDGRILEEHTEYVVYAIHRILDQYKESFDARVREGAASSGNLPKSVILVGHSMGGFVARAAIVHPHLRKSAVETVLTLSSPHQSPPVALQPSLGHYYSHVNQEWRKGNEVQNSQTGHYMSGPLSRVVVVSITGGINDYQVRSKLESLDGIVPATHGFMISTTAIKNVWLSMEHQVILWCNQLVVQVSHTLLSLIDSKTGQPFSDTRKRLEIFAKMLRSGIPQSFNWLTQSQSSQQSPRLPIQDGKDVSGSQLHILSACPRNVHWNDDSLERDLYIQTATVTVLAVGWKEAMVRHSETGVKWEKPLHICYKSCSMFWG